VQVLHGGGDGGEVKMRAEGRRHERVEESKEEESMGNLSQSKRRGCVPSRKH